MNFHDAELLSSYLDGQLGPSEAARLEARLATDAGMRRLLQDLRTTRSLLRALPQRKAPRNFTLRPKTHRLAAPTPRAFPVLRFASVLASGIFLGTVALNGLAPLAANRLAAAPAASYGMGGGGAAEAVPPPAPTESAQSLLAGAPSSTPEATTLPPTLQAPQLKTAPQPPRAAAPPASGLVPTSLQVLLAALAILLGVGAWSIQAVAARRFRQRWIDKGDR